MWKIFQERTPIRKSKNFDILSKAYEKHFRELLGEKSKELYKKRDIHFGIKGDNGLEFVLTLYNHDSNSSPNIRCSVNRRNIITVSKLLKISPESVYNQLVNLIV